MTAAADERIALGDLAGAGAVPFSFADGSCGIRGVDGATALPSAITLAATFDPQLAEEYGRALGTELRAAGHNVLLAPALDIARNPRSGRIGENLGEDPLLAGELGGRVGRGIQSVGALAMAKHYVGNNVERLRTGEGPFARRTPAVDVVMDERTLHEVYAEPFRRAIETYGVQGLLGSYNRLNGEYVCESPAVLGIPRREWGFTGVIAPDFLFAVRDARAALEAGLDLPGLDELAGRTEEMVDAAAPAVLADIAAHVRDAAAAVALAAPTGVVDGDGLATHEVLALAERVAVEGSILLRNEGALPLAARTRVALIGASWLHHRLIVGGAAAVTLSPDRIPPIAQALEDAGLRVVAEAGGIADVPLPTLRTGDKVELDAMVRDADGERRVALDAAELRANGEPADREWSAELTIALPPTPRARLLAVDFAGEVELFLDDAPLASGFREASPMIAGPVYVLQALVPPHPDRAGTLVVRYRTGPAIAVPGTPIVPHVTVGSAWLDEALDDAADAASAVDVVVVLAGRVTGEAMDADELGLPAGQPELIERLVDSGRPVVVVTHGSGPIDMPWRERVAAILHVGHPGERFAPALAAVLSGTAEPGGRLPLTVPDGAPAVGADDRAPSRLVYREGVDIGYRGHERTQRDPAYWFGHGLGYARIDLVDAVAREDAVEVALRCGGERGGKAVVQLYARVAAGETLKLVGSTVARLSAGEERRMRVAVDRHALRVREEGRWVEPTGPLEVHVGFSRGDLRAVVDIAVPVASSTMS